jgi:hypothetical protein
MVYYVDIENLFGGVLLGITGKSTDVIYSNTTWKFATDLLDQAIKIGGINGQ